MDVIVVPAEQRKHFLSADRDEIRIQSECLDGWDVLDKYTFSLLQTFLKEAADDIFMNKSKHWSVYQGVRYGFDSGGVYQFESHLKRYFGILRESASVVLATCAPAAVPKTGFVASAGGGGATEGLLGKLLVGIPAVANDLRQQTLKALFRSVDKDKSGFLEKDEVVSMMRRVTPTMSGKEVVAVMRASDTNKDGRVDYNEFVNWLTRESQGSPDETRLRDLFNSELQSEADCVRAAFRVWDKNGDGLIVMGELRKVLKKTCPDLTEKQVKTLCLAMDTDKDGQIDYAEFVHYLFSGKQGT